MTHFYLASQDKLSTLSMTNRRVLVCTWTKAAFGLSDAGTFATLHDASTSRLRGRMLLGQVFRVERRGAEKASAGFIINLSPTHAVSA